MSWKSAYVPHPNSSYLYLAKIKGLSKTMVDSFNEFPY